MSRKLSALIVGAVASLALIAGAMQGCGSSSSGGGNNYTALCEQSCDKLAMCVPDSGITADQCKQGCTSQTGTSGCSNASAIATAYQRCLSMDCVSFQSCIQNDIPDCQTTSGTGGTGGSGGTGGGGGSSGAGCSNCAKFEACCVAEGGTTADCSSLTTTCTSATAANQPTYNTACANALSQLVAADPNAPAACR